MHDNLIPYDDAGAMLDAIVATQASLVSERRFERGEWPNSALFYAQHERRVASIVLFFDGNDDEPEYVVSVSHDGRYGDFQSWRDERGSNPLYAVPRFAQVARAAALWNRRSA